MSINFDTKTFTDHLIPNFAKTVSRTPVTKTTDNVYGDETLTEGTPENISADFFRKEDEWIIDKIGLLQNADAIILVQPDQALNKDDKLTYDSEDYRVDKVVTRRLGTSAFYKVGQCFKK